MTLWKDSVKAKDDLVQRIYKYFDKVYGDTVAYYLKTKFEEIEFREEIAADTMQSPKSS